MEIQGTLKGFLLAIAASIIAGLLVHTYQDDFKAMVRSGNANTAAKEPTETASSHVAGCRLRSLDSKRRVYAEFINSTPMG